LTAADRGSRRRKVGSSVSSSSFVRNEEREESKLTLVVSVHSSLLESCINPKRKERKMSKGEEVRGRTEGHAREKGEREETNPRRA